jgi:hypothetical protein
MVEVGEGTLVRWIDPTPGQKPLGIVLPTPDQGTPNTIYVLMTDRQPSFDVEVFVARPDATGYDAANVLQQSMEVVEEGDPVGRSGFRAPPYRAREQRLSGAAWLLLVVRAVLPNYSECPAASRALARLG